MNSYISIEDPNHSPSLVQTQPKQKQQQQHQQQQQPDAKEDETNEDETNEDLLYGDLDDDNNHNKMNNDKNENGTIPTSMCRTSSNQDRETISKQNHEIQALKVELNKTLKENETLKRNIGTLYRTAKNELDRKDARILDLERKLM